MSKPEKLLVLDVRKRPRDKRIVEQIRTGLDPYLSYNFPAARIERAKMIMFKRKTADIPALPLPKSAIIGFRATPKAYLAPELKKRIRKEEPTMK